MVTFSINFDTKLFHPCYQQKEVNFDFEIEIPLQINQNKKIKCHYHNLLNHLNESNTKSDEGGGRCGYGSTRYGDRNLSFGRHG